MAIDTSTWPTSDLAEDLDPFLRDFTEDDDPVTEVVNAACGRCGATVFSVHLDDDEGAAQRTCTTCGAEFVMLDSADVIQEADLVEAACPCDYGAWRTAFWVATPTGASTTPPAPTFETWCNTCSHNPPGSRIVAGEGNCPEISRATHRP